MQFLAISVLLDCLYDVGKILAVVLYYCNCWHTNIAKVKPPSNLLISPYCRFLFVEKEVLY